MVIHVKYLPFRVIHINVGVPYKRKAKAINLAIRNPIAKAKKGKKHLLLPQQQLRKQIAMIFFCSSVYLIDAYIMDSIWQK